MKKLFLLSLVSLMSLASMAQKPQCPQQKCDFSPEKFVEMQANELVAKLGLDDKTAVKFKVIYADYMKEIHETFVAQCKKNQKQCKKDSVYAPKTDADVKADVKAQYAAQKKMIALQEKYFDKFCTVISARQAQRVMTPPMGHGQKANFGKCQGRQRFDKGCQGKCSKQGKKCCKQGKKCSKQGKCGKQCAKQCDKCENPCNGQMQCTGQMPAPQGCPSQQVCPAAKLTPAQPIPAKK